VIILLDFKLHDELSADRNLAAVSPQPELLGMFPGKSLSL